MSTATKKARVPKPAPTASQAWRAAAAEVAPPVPHTLAPITVAELHAVLGAMASAGATTPAQVAQWDVLLRFLPWYALATGRTIEQTWAMRVDQYIVGVQTRLPEIATTQRFTDAADGLSRVSALLGG